MLKTPSIMREAQDLARYAGARQSLIARNIANADTPGFKARDLVSFSDAMRRDELASTMRASRSGHILANNHPVSIRTQRINSEAAPNGNNVSLEMEMMRGTEAKSSHELALTVYSSSLDIIRTALGRGR